MGQIAVLGSANMDLVFHAPRRPAAGETIVGRGFTVGPGGKGLNQAVAAARAGASVRMLATIGSDDFGASLEHRLALEGIDTSCLNRSPLPTGVAQISVTDDGDNTIVVIPGANDDTRLTDEDRAAIEGASHLMLQLERPTALIREAMVFARAAGVTTVLTPAPVRGDAIALVELADILVPNEGEALMLSGETDAEAAAKTLSRHGALTVVTLGARGAVVAEAGGIRCAIAPWPARAVDTTAAGDTFVGYATAGLAAGMPVEAALDRAAAAASLSVTRRGAADSIPTAQEVRELAAAR